VDSLLDALEGTTGVFSKLVDIPPLSKAEFEFMAQEMRSAWQNLQKNISGMPSIEGLRTIGSQMQETADREKTSVWMISGLVGWGALQTGLRLGQTNIYDFYQGSFKEINSKGLKAYFDRVSWPYANMIAKHIDPREETYIERGLRIVKLARRKRALPERIISS
jgi:hypothetical protein